MPTHSLRILVVTSTFPRWAGDHEPPFVYELSIRLARDHDVHILAPHAPGLPVTEQLGGMQIQRFRYFFEAHENLAYQGGILAKLKLKRCNYILVPFFLLGQWWALVKLLRQQDFDIVHAHWIFPQAFITLLARVFARKPPAILCTSHGGDLFGLHGRFWNLLKRWVLAQVDAMTVVSTAMHDYIADLHIAVDKVQVIPMGVDLQHLFVPPSQVLAGPPQILFVGRLVDKKGVVYLLDAFATLTDEFPDLRLRLVGTGPLLEALQAQAVRLGIAARTEFSGALFNDELPPVYQQAMLVVFPSVVEDSGDQEGFGLVLVEALGCGCAAVTSDLPAMRDIIRDRESALVVPQKNATALAAAIRSLLQDEHLRATLGNCGRQAVLSRYDWETITRQYSRLFESTVMRRRGLP